MGKTTLTGAERQLTAAIKKNEQRLKNFEAKEAKTRAKWTRGYHAFIGAAKELTEIKRDTKRRAILAKRIKEWEVKGVSMTKERDLLRNQIKSTETELTRLRIELQILKTQQKSRAHDEDEIVEQVFALNETVVRASHDREDCLKRHVFPKLMKDGKHTSQLTFYSLDGLRKVVAMVNKMAIVRSDLAAEAKQEMENFFNRFQKVVAMDTNTKALYQMTKQLLIEKPSFKVGPDMYLFLSMDLNEDVSPELVRAQRLLRQSIRSETTGKYIRMYSRKKREDNWEPVAQS